MGSIDHKHILIFGAGGQLGKEFQYLYEEEKYPGKYSFLIKEQADITNREMMREIIFDLRPDVIINCAAYTAVDRAETDQENAHLINCISPGIMAAISAELDIPFIHFSTDYVYHGYQAVALKETDPTDPSGIYASTKLSGESEVRNANARSLIFRTSWVYSMFGNNFVRTMLRMAKDRDSLSVVNDQVGSPTWARDLARAVLNIIDQQDDLSKVSGTYNYSNLGHCSWYDFAKEIFKLASLDIRIIPIPTEDYPTPAKRPRFSLLDKSKFSKTFGIEIPEWKDSLKKCLAEMI